MQTDIDSGSEEIDYKKLFPRAYDDGYNRGIRYYNECKPFGKWSYICKYEGDASLAFAYGVQDGYQDSEQNDCTTNFIVDNYL